MLSDASVAVSVTHTLIPAPKIAEIAGCTMTLSVPPVGGIITSARCRSRVLSGPWEMVIRGPTVREGASTFVPAPSRSRLGKK